MLYNYSYYIEDVVSSLRSKSYLVLERLTPLSDNQITDKLDVDGLKPYFGF